MARKYEMKQRAEQVEETRRRITEAAVALHETVSPARTTISAVAERAGVERLTVYRHFPDDDTLFQPCSRHWLAEHPFPDLDGWERIGDPENYRSDPDKAWQRIRISSRKPEVLGRLKALAAWREREAQGKDLPRGRIVKDETIADLAGNPPRKQADLTKVRGLSATWGGNDIGGDHGAQSWRKNGAGTLQRVDPISSPRLAYESLFTDPSLGNGSAEELKKAQFYLRQRRSALDFVVEDAKRLMPRLNQLLNRAQLRREELHILRGIARAARRHVR